MKVTAGGRRASVSVVANLATSFVIVDPDMAKKIPHTAISRSTGPWEKLSKRTHAVNTILQHETPVTP